MSSASVHIPADHPAFAGHFPGQPLLPGVALLSEVLEAVMGDAALAARVGPSPRIGTVKFLAPVRPGAQLSIQFDAGASSLRFEVHGEGGEGHENGRRLVASGHFEAVA
jgi:3-hydroxymyristoyl/3-hydroxydecanoyl-(acyl carrier protein) dehydratase